MGDCLASVLLTATPHSHKRPRQSQADARCSDRPNSAAGPYALVPEIISLSIYLARRIAVSTDWRGERRTRDSLDVLTTIGGAIMHAA